MLFLDSLIIFITFYFIIRGFFKGFSRDIWSLIAFIIAFAIINYSSISFETAIKSNKNLLMINSIGSLLGLLISYYVIKKLMKYSLVLNLNFLPKSIDGILGGLSGFIKAIIILVLCTGFCNFIDIKNHKVLRESTIYALLNRIYYKINDFRDFKTYISKISTNMDYVNNLSHFDSGIHVNLIQYNKDVTKLTKITDLLNEIPSINKEIINNIQKIFDNKDKDKNQQKKANELSSIIDELNNIKNINNTQQALIAQTQLELLLLEIN